MLALAVDAVCTAVCVARDSAAATGSATTGAARNIAGAPVARAGTVGAAGCTARHSADDSDRKGRTAVGTVGTVERTPRDTACLRTEAADAVVSIIVVVGATVAT